MSGSMVRLRLQPVPVQPPHHTSFFRIESPLHIHSHRVQVRASATPSAKSSISSQTTLYQVLRIKQTASSSEIKAAYHNLAKLYHPDASNTNTTTHNFIAIHNAYATLSDPASRARYDMSILAPPTTASQTFRSTKRWETDQCW